jgi:hypothetical protein
MTPRELVDAQAEDPGLWAEAETAMEAYLQQALRRLHAAVEGEIPELICAFCGFVCPPCEPMDENSVMIAHMRECEKHPMRALEAYLAAVMDGANGMTDPEKQSEEPK